MQLNGYGSEPMIFWRAKSPGGYRAINGDTSITGWVSGAAMLNYRNRLLTEERNKGRRNLICIA